MAATTKYYATMPASSKRLLKPEALIAIGTAPTRKEAQAAQKARRPVQNGVTLVNLETGDKTAIAKIRRFALNQLGGWIALHRYGPDAASGGSAGAAASAGGRGAGSAPAVDAPRDTHPKGAGLVLHELNTGGELNIGNVPEFAFNKSGKQLAFVIDAADRAGNGVVIRDMPTGTITPLETDKFAAADPCGAWMRGGRAMHGLQVVHRSSGPRAVTLTPGKNPKHKRLRRSQR
jgi:hypothetical protein